MKCSLNFKITIELFSFLFSYAGYPMIENEFFDNQIKVIQRNRRQKLLLYRQKVDRTG